MNALLEDRKLGLGGTDIAAILGLSPYRTPYEVWLEKTDRFTAEPSPEAAERMAWGTRLEAIVAQHYADLYDRKIQRVNEPLVRGVLRGHIDRAVCLPGQRARWNGERLLGADRILEVKTAHAMARNSADWGEPMSDQVPQHYWVQVQTYLGLSGCGYADLAVLFGGQKFVTYIIPADPALFADLLDEATGWWERHVIADLPPDPSSEAEARQVWCSHVAGRDRIVDLEIAEMVGELVEVKAELKALQDQEQALRDRILPAFGDAESISYMGQRLGTWRQNRDSEKINWKDVVDRLKDFYGDEPQFVSDLATAVAQSTTIVEGARVLRLNTKE